MKASELIQRLEVAKEKFGNIEVVYNDGFIQYVIEDVDEGEDQDDESIRVIVIL